MEKNGKTGRRYSVEEKAAAVRMVRTLRADPVVDVLEMARRQRKPAPGTIVHSDSGAHYTS